MAIEIQEPGVARRVRDQIQSGRFHDIDELLTRALDALQKEDALENGEAVRSADPEQKPRRTIDEVVAHMLEASL